MKGSLLKKYFLNQSSRWKRLVIIIIFSLVLAFGVYYSLIHQSPQENKAQKTQDQFANKTLTSDTGKSSNAKKLLEPFSSSTKRLGDYSKTDEGLKLNGGRVRSPAEKSASVELNNKHNATSEIPTFNQTMPAEETRIQPMGSNNFAGGNDHGYKELEDIIGSQTSLEKEYQETFRKLQQIPEQGKRSQLAGYSQNQNCATKSAAIQGGRVSQKGGIDEYIEELASEPDRKIVRAEIMADAKAELWSDSSEKGKRIGTRDINHVNAVIYSHNASIQYCYERHLQENPNLKGKLVVRFTIAPSGKVIDAQIVSSTLNNSALEQCILSRIYRWDDFGAVEEQIGNATFRQTFSFGF